MFDVQFNFCIESRATSIYMANNGGKLARSSTLKLFKLGSNHCADDPMKSLDPPNPKKHKGGGNGRGRKKGHQRKGAGPGMQVVVSRQLFFYPYHSSLSYSLYRTYFEEPKSTPIRGCAPCSQSRSCGTTTS